jgi:hypothetical protein
MGAQFKLVRLEVSDETRLSRIFLVIFRVEIRVFGQVRDEILSRDSLPRLEWAVLGSYGHRLG